VKRIAVEAVTHHSDEYSVPDSGKPRLSQYAAQTAGVMVLDEVDAEMRARPVEPSAMSEVEAKAKPAGRPAAAEG
jgi:hypothetical protein